MCLKLLVFTEGNGTWWLQYAKNKEPARRQSPRQNIQGNESISPAHVETVMHSYVVDGDTYNFMDQDTFENYEINRHYKDVMVILKKLK